MDHGTEALSRPRVVWAVALLLAGAPLLSSAPARAQTEAPAAEAGARAPDHEAKKTASPKRAHKPPGPASRPAPSGPQPVSRQSPASIPAVAGLGKDGKKAPAREASRDVQAPIYKRWWFWTIIGVAVVGGSVAAVAATTGGDDRVPEGPLVSTRSFLTWSRP